MLVSCIRSILESDYTGNIVVISNDSQVKRIEEYNNRVSFAHIPSSVVCSGDYMIGNYISNCNTQYDYFIWLHNDVIMPPIWYEELEEAWDKFQGKVWAISLPYVAHNWKVRDSNYILDTDTLPYNDIIKKYKSIEMSFLPYTTGKEDSVGSIVDICQAKPEGARISCACAIDYNFYNGVINKYGYDTGHTLDLLLLREGIISRKWGMFLNSLPVIHWISYDTVGNNILANHNPTGYKRWFEHIGYNLEHLIAIWCGTIYNKYNNEIVSAWNTNRFSDIDYIFDEADVMISNLDCSNCSSYYYCNSKNSKVPIHF